MSVYSRIQSQTLEITVIACNKLKNTQTFGRQDPYVYFEYGGFKYRTKTCTDGYTSPTFNEKFQIELIEGLREINVSVWNSNTLRRDDFIGCGRIQLNKVIAEGFDDSVWHLQTDLSRYAGDLKLIMHCPKTLQRCQTVPVRRVSDPSCSIPPAYPPQSPTSYHYHPSPMHYSEFPSPAYPPPSPSYQSPAHSHYNRSGSYHGTYPPAHHYN